ncbi:MAG: methyltransferase domain-containing protein [Actinomycetota bacterium]|nr:methyltransferase domain-containing protein [Actinomycetota bacterium]MDQ5817788.1 methyltransferase domain-containing protein [Actinomycetota bacterium]
MDEALDPYRITDKLEDALLDGMVSRLEARGNHWFFQDVLREYLDAMDIDSANTVLDMGCGTGVAARTVTRRVNFSGRATGIDLSPYLVRAAERLADEEGLGGRVEFRTGDTRALGIPEGRFDAVVAHTLVSHVQEALLVIKEAGKVIRPGGLIAIFDGDYASMTFALDDPVQSKRYDEALISAVVTSPRVMRQMPRLIQQAGLEMIRVFPYIMAEVGTGDFWLSGIDSFEKLAPKSGAMTEAQATSWANALHRASDEGVFFGASNYYTYIARRPD